MSMTFQRLCYFFTFAMIFMTGCQTSLQQTPVDKRPIGFVSLSDVSPLIIQEIRYATNHNFVGYPIPGYEQEKCILTEQAAKALVSVQRELSKFSMTLKVYDCYRPQRSVNFFVQWAKDLRDNKMKAEFYPRVEKANLFKDGYIAQNSGHSRGSAVDLTIVPTPPPIQSVYHQGDELQACYLPASKRFHDIVI